MHYPPPPYGPLPLPPGLPPRPVYREPHRIGTAPLLSGMAATTIWFALFGFIGSGLVSYAWWTVVAAVSAWIVAVVLSLLGDRGVATGVAIVAGLGLSIAMGFVTYRWIVTLDFPLW